jgi:hypothetical protein
LFSVASTGDSGETRITCQSCGSERTVFDPAIHGYEGELGIGMDTPPAPAEDVVCDGCGGRTFRVALAFQYSGETDVLDEDDPPDVRPEDLFGWVVIAAECAECGKIQQVAETECA